METFDHLKTYSVVDLQVSVADVDVSTGVEVVGETQAIGSVAAMDPVSELGREKRLGVRGCPKVA